MQPMNSTLRESLNSAMRNLLASFDRTRVEIVSFALPTRLGSTEAEYAPTATSTKAAAKSVAVMAVFGYFIISASFRGIGRRTEKTKKQSSNFETVTAIQRHQQL